MIQIDEWKLLEVMHLESVFMLYFSSVILFYKAGFNPTGVSNLSSHHSTVFHSYYSNSYSSFRAGLSFTLIHFQASLPPKSSHFNQSKSLI